VGCWVKLVKIILYSLARFYSSSRTTDEKRTRRSAFIHQSAGQKPHTSGSFYWSEVDLYLLKFLTPQRPSANSSASPTEKESDGSPSTIKLMILPNARPIIKNTFEIVAIRQWDGLKIPITQSATVPMYNPIVALKTWFKSTDSTLKSKSMDKILLGNKPYVNETTIIIIAEIIKCRFFFFKI